MDRLKQILAIAFILGLQHSAMSQNDFATNQWNTISKTINESIFIHANANTLISGETLHYKLYCLNTDSNMTSKYSKIAYVELIDSNKKSVFNHKLFLENGSGNGDFFIPTTLDTGNYKLIGYTSWMLNQTQPEFFNIDISIINPYQLTNKKPSAVVMKDSISTKGIDDQSKSTGNITNTPKNIWIDLEQKKYSNREKVSLKINTVSDEFLEGDYAISVRKTDQLSSKKQVSTIAYATSKKPSNTELIANTNDLILPELRGEIISGRIFSKNKTNSVENKSVAFCLPGKTYTTRIAKTDKEGKFHFNLEKNYSNSNCIIQIISPNHDDYSIEIAKPKPINYTSLSFNTDVELKPEFRKSIEERAIASQIENNYYNRKKDSLTQTNDFRPFFDPLSKEYLLDDFTRFPTIKETIVEIINDMYYKNNDNKYSLHLNNYYGDNVLSLPALVIVDGLIIQDINELFEYKANNIYKINIVKGGYYLGPDLYNGMISFTTKTHNYETKSKGDYVIKPEIPRPLGKLDYFQPDYSEQGKNTRIPDYRYQLLWMPKVVLKNKEQDFSFFTSDVKGKFEVILEGFSAKGLPILIKEGIEVE